MADNIGGQAVRQSNRNDKRLAQTRWLQSARRGQDALYRNAGTQGLTWEVILIAAEAHYAAHDLNVTDVCVSVGASKSTVLKLIAQLTEDKILAKAKKKGDSRTHLLRLGDGFQKKFEKYLDEQSRISAKV